MYIFFCNVKIMISVNVRDHSNAPGQKPEWGNVLELNPWMLFTYLSCSRHGISQNAECLALWKIKHRKCFLNLKLNSLPFEKINCYSSATHLYVNIFHTGDGHVLYFAINIKNLQPIISRVVRVAVRVPLWTIGNTLFVHKTTLIKSSKVDYVKSLNH